MENLVPLSGKIEAETKNELEAIAIKEETSVSTVIRWAIRDFLKRHNTTKSCTNKSSKPSSK
jgi:predicted transcriptional regulator